MEETTRKAYESIGGYKKILEKENGLARTKYGSGKGQV
jgi:hypothetical protein